VIGKHVVFAAETSEVDDSAQPNSICRIPEVRGRTAAFFGEALWRFLHRMDQEVGGIATSNGMVEAVGVEHIGRYNFHLISPRVKGQKFRIPRHANDLMPLFQQPRN
jgi:hypothetical protein